MIFTYIKPSAQRPQCPHAGKATVDSASLSCAAGKKRGAKTTLEKGLKWNQWNVIFATIHTIHTASAGHARSPSHLGSSKRRKSQRSCRSLASPLETDSCNSWSFQELFHLVTPRRQNESQHPIYPYFFPRDFTHRLSPTDFSPTDF